MTLQKLLEAHIEKKAHEHACEVARRFAALPLPNHDAVECARLAYIECGSDTAPLLLAAVEAMSLVQQNHRLVHKEKCYPNPSDDTRVVCLCGSEKLTETLSLIAASLKEGT